MMRNNRKPRRFRHRSNNRGFFSRDNGIDKNRVGSRSFSNGRARNNFKPYQNPEKLVEKYSAMAKEALSSGDKILSENYFQHADHYMRLVDNKNTNQNQTNNPQKEPENKSAINNSEVIKKDQITEEN